MEEETIANTAGSAAPEPKKNAAPEATSQKTTEAALPPPPVVPPAPSASAPRPLPPAPSEAPQKPESKSLASALLTVAPDLLKEKLAPKAPPTPPPVPVATAKDFLHGGNAILAAQEQQGEKKTIPTAGLPPEKDPETELERNLREAGLREALQRPGAAPPKVGGIEAPEDAEGVPRIRTYAEDMSEEMRKRGAALSTIIAAEQERPAAPEPTAPPITKRGRLFAIAAVFLILLGIGIASAAFIFFAPPSNTTTQAPTIIPVNHHGTVEVTDKMPAPLALAQARASAGLALGEMEGYTVTENGVPLSAYEILTALGAPNELARNATGILVGVHQTDHQQPFLLISVAAYDSAFSAMLAWEGTMGDSLGNFFAPSSVPANAVAVHAPALSFTDDITDNLDIRHSQSAWPILYAFPRRDLLLITTNESTLREVLSRLSLQGASGQ